MHYKKIKQGIHMCWTAIILLKVYGLIPSLAGLKPCEYLFALAVNKSAVNAAKTPVVKANMNNWSAMAVLQDRKK